MPEPTPMSWATTWVSDPLGLLLAVVLTGGDAAGLLAAHRRGTTRPWGRTAGYVLLGVGSLLLAPAARSRRTRGRCSGSAPRRRRCSRRCPLWAWPSATP